MPNTYKITVKNQTGGPQNYSFFSATPLLSGAASGNVWSNVLKSTNRAPNGSSSSFQFSDNYYAICGSFEGKPDHGGSITVSKSVPISLGSKSGTNVTMGSSVKLDVFDGQTCDLGPPTTPGQGKLGNFQLSTEGANFTIQQAKDNNLLVGIASSKDGDITTAIGSFTPYPNAKYQIQPTAVFYVAAGDRFEVGSLVKVEMTSNSMAVDFAARGTNNVTLIHDETMSFSFE